MKKKKGRGGGGKARLSGSLEAEALRQVEVHLYGRALPRAADGVLDLHVDLGTVEGPAALVHAVGPALAAERRSQRRLGLLPDLVRADRLGRPGGEVDLVVGEAEGGEDLNGVGAGQAEGDQEH